MSGTVDDELKSVQLRRAKLELEKLEEDLRRLKVGRPWYEILSQYSGWVAAMVAALGFAFAIVQYASQQRQNRETAERELMKPWLENQRTIYMRALSAATTIANTDDSAKRKTAVEEFWGLYQGAMILVETKSVSGGMVRFGHCLSGADACDGEELNARCRALASAMAESMGATARMTFAEFAKNQFRYSGGR